MIFKLPGFARRANTAVIDRIYGEIVTAARQPAFYAEMGVPDTPLGRFEMLSLHLFMLFRRARSSANAGLDSAVQDVTDEFFKDVDHSLRELGIGDMGVPKRMKKLARMFYGRCNSYGEALDAGDAAALATALSRNIRPDLEDAGWPGATALASYVGRASAFLDTQDDAALLEGRIAFMPMGEGAGQAEKADD
ncbi:MAG: ubiquinol-cytochrome C chaperone [Brucellaceae bacterium]|nr:ubiquinol-cytochrome C chaperone [Brucellaceae bacterium]